jgi:hypothetical protein
MVQGGPAALTAAGFASNDNSTRTITYIRLVDLADSFFMVWILYSRLAHPVHQLSPGIRRKPAGIYLRWGRVGSFKADGCMASGKGCQRAFSCNDDQIQNNNLVHYRLRWVFRASRLVREQMKNSTLPGIPL